MPLIYQALPQMSSLTTTATSAACVDSSKKNNSILLYTPSFGRSLETRQPVSEEGEVQQKHLLQEKAGSNYLCVA